MTKHKVPALSQHIHIQDPEWKEKSCGIVSLTMLFNYFGKEISADQLLKDGITNNAYLKAVGWKHKELAELGKQYGLNGENLDWTALDAQSAYQKATGYLNQYPIMASVYNNFEPGNSGHLIVITGATTDKIFYNDPDAKNINNISKEISLKKFLNGWKKRIIIINKKRNAV
ncbi:MAG: C39 family peptidase [Candidatus Harrisonbacteria bacterium]|nr:C39 family peptidase [Candidatus Harrisonbacteria bacterium]